MGTLTIAISGTCDRPTYAAIARLISSLGLGGGATRSVSLDGLTIERSGPAHAHVNLSARQARKKGLLTSGIFGPTGTGLSSSAALQSSLESRLRGHLTGSPWCTVTWKRWATPWGQSLSKPRASVHGSSETDFGLSPAMTATNARGNAYTYSRGDKMKPRLSLVGKVRLLPALTATSYGSNRGGAAGRTGKVRYSLPALIARDARTAAARPKPRQRGTLPLICQIADMQGSNTGGLNPPWTAWFMGYPVEWAQCAPSAMPSSRKSRPSSSER